MTTGHRMALWLCGGLPIGTGSCNIVKTTATLSSSCGAAIIHLGCTQQDIVSQGNSVTVRWTPAHREVEGNGRADQVARDAASLPPLGDSRRRFSLAFLRRRATERSVRAWRRDTERRGSGRRTFELPSHRSRPSIRPLCGQPPRA